MLDEFGFDPDAMVGVDMDAAVDAAGADYARLRLFRDVIVGVPSFLDMLSPKDRYRVHLANRDLGVAIADQIAL
jgi:hypothetical protein